MREATKHFAGTRGRKAVDSYLVISEATTHAFAHFNARRFAIFGPIKSTEENDNAFIFFVCGPT